MPKSLFYSNASAKAEILELEGKIATLETGDATTQLEITRLTAELGTVSGSLATMTTERDEAVTAYEQASKAGDKATADLAIANEKLAKFPSDVEAAAQAKFASLGGSPIAETKSENGAPITAKTMAEFNALTPAARMAFVKSGGKLTD